MARKLMPRRKNTKKYAKGAAKRNKTRRISTAGITSLNPFVSGFPKKILVKHRYATAVGINASTGTLVSTQISCNGLYQPNVGGHQPMYFDQLTPLYDHYCVIGSKIKVIASPDSATSITKPLVFGLYVNDDTSGYASNMQAVQEFQQGKTKVLNYNATRPVTLSARWSAKKFFSKNPLANPELQGTSSSNPTEQSFFQICAQDITQAVNATLDVWVEVEYIAIWKELKDIAQS